MLFPSRGQVKPGELKYAPYSRALAEPYAYGDKVLHERTGFVLQATLQGTRYYSEASPLPGHSAESLEQVAAALAIGDHSLPSIRFGLEALAAQSQPFRGPLRSNGLLPWRGLEATRELAEDFLREGYAVLKLKVMENALEEQLQFLRSFPRARFRLDANGVLSPRAQRELFEGIRKIGPAHFDYLEEPGQWTLAPLPLAADESVAKPSALASVLVGKPMVQGGELLRGLRRVVYTTTLEAEPGRRALLAWLSACDSSEIHGLSTGFLFRGNFLEDRPEWTELPPIGAAEQAWLDSLKWSSS